MPFKVTDFRAELEGDGARPNLFEVHMTFPQLAITGSAGTGPISAQGAQRKLTFMARAAQLPGDTINQVPVYHMGREFKFAGNRTFQEWTLTIINDEDFLVRDAFEKWMSGINSHVGNLRAEQFRQGDGGYQQDARVIQYAKTGEIIKAYTIVGAWPIDVSPIELDYGAQDTIEEFAVTLAYQWWESDTTDRSTTIPDQVLILNQ